MTVNLARLHSTDYVKSYGLLSRQNSFNVVHQRFSGRIVKRSREEKKSLSSVTSNQMHFHFMKNKKEKRHTVVNSKNGPKIDPKRTKNRPKK